MIINRIMDAYFELREKYYNKYYKGDMQVVIRTSPKGFNQLIVEDTKEIFTDYELGIHFINLCGDKTPIIIDDTLSNEVEFLLQYRQDYERMEKEKLMERFFKMFD